MYKTIKGTELNLSKKLWRGIKKIARKKFDGSSEFFESCWRQYRQFLNGSIDDPKNINDVMRWLDSIASEKVNNPKSKFYIDG